MRHLAQEQVMCRVGKSPTTETTKLQSFHDSSTFPTCDLSHSSMRNARSQVPGIGGIWTPRPNAPIMEGMEVLLDKPMGVRRPLDKAQHKNGEGTWR